MSAYKAMDPTDSLTWQHDWTDFLSGGETVSSRLWTISPDNSPSLLSNTTAASVVVGGLSAGVVYRLSEKITTSAGNVAERAITLRCEDM